MIRVLLAEDQAMVRGALAALLTWEGDFEIVAEVGRGDEVLEAALAAQPDVALLDIEMPGCDGISAAAMLREHLPACRVLILTTFGRPGYLRRAMASGVVGFLLKEAPSAQLASAIRRTLAGGHVIDPALTMAAFSDGENPLNKREQAILAASSRGSSVAEIATSLSFSEGTVRNYLSMAIQKVGARNRIEAANIAREKGWL